MIRTPLAALTLGLTLGLSLVAGPALAQQCAPRDVVTERLNLTFGESFGGGGLQGEDAVYEVWVSEEEGTWTILLTRADGMSCIMAAGTDWRKALASEKVVGQPA